jgi:hypothetical protein
MGISNITYLIYMECEKEILNNTDINEINKYMDLCIQRKRYEMDLGVIISYITWLVMILYCL